MKTQRGGHMQAGRMASEETKLETLDLEILSFKTISQQRSIVPVALANYLNMTFE